MLVLIAHVARGRPAELWIGDSHAAHYNDGLWPCPPFRGFGDGRFVWHLGPRLMWSITRDGFPRRVHALARVLRGLWRRRALTVFCVFGEIDVRCHLAPRVAEGASLEFVQDYVAQVQALGEEFGAATTVVVVPPPPNESYPNAAEFPIQGTIAERLAAFDQVRAGLVAGTAAGGLRLLDATDEFALPSGQLRPELSIDGCHVNGAGRLVLRRRLGAVGG
jgi:hypothetical protein